MRKSTISNVLKLHERNITQLLVFGFIIGSMYGKYGRQCNSRIETNTPYDDAYLQLRMSDKQTGSQENTRLMFVGIQTTEEYMVTRAKAAFETWVHSIHGDSKFFIGNETTEESKINNGDIPIVRLPYVNDNSYPPQRKSFYMLKYMNDHYIDDYGLYEPMMMFLSMVIG